MIGDHARKLRALAQHGIDHLADVIARGEPGDLGEGVAEHAFAVRRRVPHGRVESGAPHQCLLALVQHGEMRRDLRLEREALQQALAKAMDGVDLEPALGLERAREQAPRDAQLVLVGRAPHQRRKLLVQNLGLADRPVGKHLEQAVLHLRRRRLGVSQAKDRLGPEAREQQPQAPLDQDRRLSCPGIGRNPSRSRRVGGARLVRVGFRGKGPRAHRKSSSASCVSHSFTRARCSYSS